MCYPLTNLSRLHLSAPCCTVHCCCTRPPQLIASHTFHVSRLTRFTRLAQPPSRRADVDMEKRSTIPCGGRAIRSGVPSVSSRKLAVDADSEKLMRKQKTEDAKLGFLGLWRSPPCLPTPPAGSPPRRHRKRSCLRCACWASWPSPSCSPRWRCQHRRRRS